MLHQHFTAASEKAPERNGRGEGNVFAGATNEVEALAEAMRALERADEVGDADGAGDLLDDFVLTAATRVLIRPAPLSWHSLTHVER